MASEEKSSSALPVSGIVGLLIVAAAWVTHETQLQSARPMPQDARHVTRPWLQDIDSRLWQDPMEVVSRHREAEREAAAKKAQLAKALGLAEAGVPNALPPDDTHAFDQKIARAVQKTVCAEHGEPVHVIAAMVLGGSKEEDREMRRRTRYAVVSALARADYLPDNSDAIGYAYLPQEMREKLSGHLAEVIPFEWFARETANPGKEASQWALVLWLDQSNFYHDPLRRLRFIFDAMAPQCKSAAFTATVLGPVDSGSLIELVNDIRGERSGASSDLSPLTIVSASATAPLALEEKAKPSETQYAVKSASTTLLRVIGPDDRLSCMLIKELGSRGLVPAEVNCDQGGPRSSSVGAAPGDGKRKAVIVVSEQDTDYGRGFIKQIDDLNRSKGFDVQSFSYLREIDGGTGTATPRRTQGAEPESEKTREDRYARSQGTHHVDYLRRLVTAIEQYSHAGQGGDKDVVAIAIFGNDVYDKLLILRALKPAFPNALFMTTDLDARLLDREELEWTRNLVVATNYAFTLSPGLQGGTAPFRDGYQTATYLGTLLIAGGCVQQALSDASPAWLQKPLLFEVGRSTPVPLESVDSSPAAAGLGGCAIKTAAASPLAVQPPLARPAPPGARSIGAVAGGMAVLVLFGLALFRFADHGVSLRSLMPSRRPKASSMASGIAIPLAGALVAWAILPRLPDVPPLVTSMGCALVLCIGFFLIQDNVAGVRRRTWLGLFLAGPALYLLAAGARIALTPNDEPFAWAEGVSVWPTQLIRVAAGALASYGLWHIASFSLRDARALTAKYCLRNPVPDADGGVVRIWERYVARRSSRAMVTIGFVVLYFAGSIGLVTLFDARPGIPVRGAGGVGAVMQLLGFVIVMSVTLLVAVALAYRGFVVGLVRPLARAPLAFPAAALEPYLQALGTIDRTGAERFVNRVLAVKLIAERSVALTRFIYLPFAVFALLLVARSALFDNWDTPLALGLVLLLPFVVVIACVGWLRWETVRLHLEIVRDLRERLVALRGAGATETQMWQLEQWLDAVRSEHRGSFQNLALQPLIRALLMPIGGFSGVQILEQLLRQ